MADKTDFQKAIKFTLSWEGGYVNDPADPGGETKYGISKRSYPKVNIKELTREQAIEIYHRDFWFPAMCEALPGKLAIVHFDTAVNCGIGTAARKLQTTVAVTADGKIGMKTISAANNGDVEWKCKTYCTLRGEYYRSLIEKNPKLGKFLGGWMRRVSALEKLVLSATSDN